MDVPVAEVHRKRAGFMGRYWSVIVCWSEELPAGKDQSMYMFQMDDETWGNPDIVYVGTRNGSVFAKFDAQQKDLPTGGRLAPTT